MWLTGPVAPWHVGSSQTRARTCVPCIGRQILNHCATREALPLPFNNPQRWKCSYPLLFSRKWRNFKYHRARAIGIQGRLTFNLCSHPGSRVAPLTLEGRDLEPALSTGGRWTGDCEEDVQPRGGTEGAERVAWGWGAGRVSRVWQDRDSGSDLSTQRICPHKGLQAYIPQRFL